MSKEKQAAEILELKGQPVDRPSRAQGAPGFQGGRPVMPKTLGPVAAKEWRRLCRELYKRGTSTKLDGTILELHCITWTRYQAAQAEIGDKFFVDIPVTDSNGAVFWKRGANPALIVLEKCEAILKQTLKELGATPASRAVKQMTQQGRLRNAPPLAGSAAEFLLED